MIGTAQTEYDAVVIGGGPGGSCAAGFLARSGWKVVLFEKERFPRHRIGESLLPATTMGILNKLGAMELIEKQGFTKKYGGTFLWGKEDKPWTFNFYRTSEADATFGDHPVFLHSFQVERTIFDKLLLDHARTLGAEVHEECAFQGVDDLDAEVKSVRVRLANGETTTVRTRFIVDAGGRNSLLRNRFGERHYDPFFKNVALYNYFEGGKRMPGERWGNILCFAFQHGWFWYIPLTKELTSVGLVLGREKYNEMKGLGEREFFNQMVECAPMIKDFLATAKPCERAPYNQFRTDIDYSYIHSQFSHNGTFLVGDAACFIDPVFSSGVHLATFSAYLAASAIDGVLKKTKTYEDSAVEYEARYRREYMAFYRFLISFYELHSDHDSYFWEARKLLDRKHGTDTDAFISLVSGQSTAGDLIFSPETFEGTLRWGVQSLTTLISKASDREVKPTAQEIASAREFIIPTHEARHQLLKKSPE